MESGEQPGLVDAATGFEIMDFLGVAQGQADIVPAVEQTLAAEGIHLKGNHLAVGTRNRPVGEIHRQAIALAGETLGKQRIHFGSVQLDRQQAVLEAVVEENVGKAGADDHAEPEILQRPRSMLAGTTATEIIAGKKDLRPLITGLVKDELRVLGPAGIVLTGLADIQVTPFVEQVRAETAALDRLEELLGNDRVGVDVGTIHRRHETVEFMERLHLLGYLLDGFATLFNILAESLNGVATGQEHDGEHSDQHDEFTHIQIPPPINRARARRRNDRRSPPQLP